MSDVFHIIPPQGKQVPILLSIPHVGMEVPKELDNHYVQDLVVKPDDTDFYLDQLYDFAPAMGVTTIYARLSRWVIDLNRSPENVALYADGRMITGLTPLTDFQGNSIYQHTTLEPGAEEIQRRKRLYYYPYYEKITALLKDMKDAFGQVIFWDAHSIREEVPSIQSEKFPPLILGTNDETSADRHFIRTALRTLRQGNYQVSHNMPFKGGNLTRHFGCPAEGIHALQLEMIKKLYMDDSERAYDGQKADSVKNLLSNTFRNLVESLKNISL